MNASGGPLKNRNGLAFGECILSKRQEPYVTRDGRNGNGLAGSAVSGANGTSARE
jgi:hypothetical protein